MLVCLTTLNTKSPLRQGSSSAPYGHSTHREMERPMESYRSGRRYDDEPQHNGRVQQRQVHTDRYDSRRLPSPPRQQQQHHQQPPQQQQQRLASDDANRRVSAGSTHDWADDDDGEMNFNEPLLILSNRSAALLSFTNPFSLSPADYNDACCSPSAGSATLTTSRPPLRPTTTLQPKCSKSRQARCCTVSRPCSKHRSFLHVAAVA